MKTRLCALVLIVSFLVSPTSALAAQYKPFEISGWIPYWKGDTAIADATAHIDVFTEINPFGYTMKANGTLNDAANLDSAQWQALIALAHQKNIRVIPTITWGSGDAIHEILSNTKKRIALEDEIAALVKEKGFDGIDIDFEGKKAETKGYFSTFLKGLYMRMGNKWVMCTIEARIPPKDRFDTIPADLSYANDFKEINKYCDRVRFMTYDQTQADLTLLRANAGSLYSPIADPKWVEKAIAFAAKDIPKRKIMIGIATYGYESDVFDDAAAPTGKGYQVLWAFNFKYAQDLATKMGIVPTRNSAGEMQFTYPASHPNAEPPVPLPNATRLLTWSDAEAIKQKVDLAKRLKVRGISIFKIDGGEDPAMWPILEAAAK